MIVRLLPPDEMQLELAEKCVRAGDYRRARQIATEIASREDLKPEERARVKKILLATGIDPVAVFGTPPDLTACPVSRSGRPNRDSRVHRRFGFCRPLLQSAATFTIPFITRPDPGVVGFW